MDTCPSVSSYDYPWQATLTKVSLRFKYEFDAVTNISETSHRHVPKKLTEEARYMICIISIFLMLAVIGTSITVYDKYFNRNKKRRLSSDVKIDCKNDIHSYRQKSQVENSEEVWFKKLKAFFSAFCIYTNGRKILTTVPKEGEVLWLNGIRLIGTLWAIAVHVSIGYYISVRNLNGLKRWTNHWFAPFIFHGTCVISLFLVLSGFLNGYLMSRDYFKNEGRISWLHIYRKRILRIAPLYAMVLGCYAVLFSYTSSGPVWPTYNTNPVCKESWWGNLFFINNFQILWKQCYIPAWYVAADMQLLFISPLFLISLFKWPRFGYSLIVLGILASCCFRTIMTIKYDLLDNLSSTRNYIDDFDKFVPRVWNFVDLVYIKPVSNLCAYLIGLGLGHYLWKRETCKKGRNNRITLCCGWIGFAISMWICFDVLYFSKETLLKHIAFNGFSDLFFSGGMAWIIYVCATKQGDFVKRFLSLKFFLPLSRLSLAAYLINLIVILHYFLSLKKQEENFSIPSAISILFHVNLWTYILSFIASLFIELPMSRLLR